MTASAWMILALFALALLGVLTARSAAGRILVYGGSVVVCAGFIATGFLALTGPVERLVLPLGLPWIGTNLRLDALSGFFLALIGVGGAGASLFAVGYGRHEAHPNACCRSTRRFWPEWHWWCWPTTPSPSCSPGN